jgi:hypothetical protein
MYNEEKYFDNEKLLDEVLKADPGFTLSDNFADRVAEKAGRKFAWMQYFYEFLIYLGSFAGIAAVTVAMAFIWYGANLQDWLAFLSGNISLVAGLSFLLVFILFADRVLLRYFLYRSSNLLD